MADSFLKSENNHGWLLSFLNLPYQPTLWRSLYVSSSLIFSKFCPPTTLPLTSNPTTLSVALLCWLNWWLHHMWRCAILLNVVDLHMSSLSTMVPEEPRRVFYACNKVSNLLEVWHIATHSQLVPQTHMPFRRSRCHLVSGTKP